MEVTPTGEHTMSATHLTLLPHRSDGMTDEQYLEDFASQLDIAPAAMHEGVFYRRTAMSCCPVTMGEMDEILEALAFLLTTCSEFSFRELKWLKEQELVHSVTRITHVLQWLCEEGVLQKEGRTYYLCISDFLGEALEALEALPREQEHPTHFAGELSRIQRYNPMYYAQKLLHYHQQ